MTTRQALGMMGFPNHHEMEQRMSKDFKDPALLPDFIRNHRLAMLAIEDPRDPDYDGEQELLPAGTLMADAEVITSWTGEMEDIPNVTSQDWTILSKLPETFHRPVLDLDFDAALIPSTSADHHHLYLGKVLKWSDYVKLLDVLAEVGIIEPGYRDASIAREFTSVRLPWVTKELPKDPAPEHEERKTTTLRLNEPGAEWEEL